MGGGGVSCVYVKKKKKEGGGGGGGGGGVPLLYKWFNTHNEAMKMQRFNFHQKLKSYNWLCNIQTHQQTFSQYLNARHNNDD